MRSSNPVFSSLTDTARRSPSQGGFSSQPGAGYPSAPQGGFPPPPQGNYSGGPQQGGFGSQQWSAPQPVAPTQERALTVDDIITKTAITIGVIVAAAAVAFVISLQSPGLGAILTGIGGIGGFITVMVSTIGRKFGSAVVTLVYAVFEGLFVGGLSFFFAGVSIGKSDGFFMILEAVVATIGVFIGMLYAYKSGAVKVTDKFRRFITGAIIGVLILAVVNLVLSFMLHINPLTNGGPLAIIFSLVCIVLAALSFLTDFDQADRLVRSGVSANYAWGVALSLAVTLVWLYTEILRLLSYFNRN